MSKSTKGGKRGRARVLLVQAFYQMQITDHDLRELRSQFTARPEYERVDQDYFDTALKTICDNRDDIESSIAEYSDRPVEQLDPVERGILLLGFYELQSVTDVPYRVVINEAVNLAKRMGAEDGYKFINALLDGASIKLRPAEHE